MRTRAACALALLGLSSASAACGRSPLAVARSAALAREPAEAKDGVSAGDADTRIARVLLDELDRQPILARERIHVDVTYGIVALEAKVADRLAKQRAVEVARLVRGVRAIIDRIEVSPVRGSDRDLELVVQGVLSTDPVTAPVRIAVSASKGVIRLSGEVDSIGTQRIAVRDVLAIPGVSDVADDLAVRPERLPIDRAATAVERIVHDDPWLDGSRVRIQVRDHAIALSGLVASGAERARTEDDARKASPSRIDVTALQIEPVYRDDGTRRAEPNRAASDPEIAEAIREAFAIDPRVRCAPTVEVRDGVVVLTGLAPTGRARRAAEEDAVNAPGVVRVEDDLKERRSLVAEDDVVLQSQVAAMIASDPLLGTLHIAVEVVAGRVILRGTVPTATDRMRAISLASLGPGALDVNDGGLTVAPARLAGVPAPLAAIPRGDTRP